MIIDRSRLRVDDGDRVSSLGKWTRIVWMRALFANVILEDGWVVTDDGGDRGDVFVVDLCLLDLIELALFIYF